VFGLAVGSKDDTGSEPASGKGGSAKTKKKRRRPRKKAKDEAKQSDS
jgi:hypothetical protein